MLRIPARLAGEDLLRLRRPRRRSRPARGSCSRPPGSPPASCRRTGRRRGAARGRPPRSRPTGSASSNATPRCCSGAWKSRVISISPTQAVLITSSGSQKSATVFASSGETRSAGVSSSVCRIPDLRAENRPDRLGRGLVGRLRDHRRRPLEPRERLRAAARPAASRRRRAGASSRSGSRTGCPRSGCGTARPARAPRRPSRAPRRTARPT